MTSPEDLHFESPVLSSVTVGIRIFQIGEPKNWETFQGQVDTVAALREEWKKSVGPNQPQVVIITNSDLELEGQHILEQSGLQFVIAQRAKAERRAKHGRQLVKKDKSEAKGDFSYADMLNALQVGQGERAFVSSDMVRDPKKLLETLKTLKRVYDKYMQMQPNRLAMIGALLGGVHDQNVIQAAIQGQTEIAMSNVHRVFPNNALSLLPPDAEFSGVADNKLAGTLIVEDKEVPVGGNEDFLYAFEAMVYEGRDAVLVVDFSETQERQGEVMGDQSKYVRRQAVYRAYAERAVRQAIKREKIEWDGQADPTEEDMERIVKDILDRHLFFALINDRNEPEIVLTARQKEKSIIAPF